MKLKKYLYTGVALLSLTACNDFLDVDAPSAYTTEFVFSQKSEISRALNGVYAQALVGDLYGNAYLSKFNLNSDVDIAISSATAHSHTSYQRLDCDDQGGDIYKFWTAAYSLIEYCNKFVTAAESSSIYDESDAELMQWIGEAKCLRAMAYHDLTVMFGDVPFTMTPSAEHGTDFIIPIADRLDIQKALIEDLQKASISMSSTRTTTVERCSKEFAQALIARIAMTAGGYTLRPEKSNPQSYGKMERPANYLEFYQIANAYADSVILAGVHSLKLGYQDVFVGECNYQVVNDDDPIFELPFAKESTGNMGYSQGPTYTENEGETVGKWGKCDGGVRLNAFYRFLFRKGDLRREYVNGLWYYGNFANSENARYDSIVIRNDYSVHNNKWSKLWTSETLALGKDKQGSTGINYPYMRYADVLLMYAETANELNDGPTPKALDCLQKVHNRAFVDGDPTYTYPGDKEGFLKAVLDERKWEFAGENSRWRDLVRTNTYAEELVYSFLRYFSAGVQNTGGVTGYEDMINDHDRATQGITYGIDALPGKIYYHQFSATESIKPTAMVGATGSQFYGYTIAGTGINLYFDKKYPNQQLKSLRIYNAYENKPMPAKSAITSYDFAATEWNNADFYQWGDANSGQPKAQCLYSFYGFMRGDANGNIYIVKDGSLVPFEASFKVEELPVARYILPYPYLAIQRSAGAYKNYYGY